MRLCHGSIAVKGLEVCRPHAHSSIIKNKVFFKVKAPCVFLPALFVPLFSQHLVKTQDLTSTFLFFASQLQTVPHTLSHTVPSETPSQSESRQGQAGGETFMRCRYLCRKAFLLLTQRKSLDADQAEPDALKHEAGPPLC